MFFEEGRQREEERTERLKKNREFKVRSIQKDTLRKKNGPVGGGIVVVVVVNG